MKMDKRMRVYLTQKKNSNNYVYIDDIINEVNVFDKSFGLRLKHPEIFYDNSTYSDEMNRYANSVLGTLFARLNSISPHAVCNLDIDDEDYGEIQDEENMSMLLSKYSNLKWDVDDRTFDISSIVFKMRFMSCIILSMLNNVRKISKNIVKKGKGYYSHSIDEQVYLLVPEVVSDIVTCTRLMLAGKPYRNTLIKTIIHTTYLKKKIKQNKIVEYVEYDMVPVISNMLPSGLTGIKLADDDVVIHSMLGCGYVWTTNNPKYYKVLPEFDYVKGATRKHDLHKLIEALGVAIVKEKISEAFDAFITSDPKVSTDFSVECANNRELTMGMYALEFVKFIYNDKHIARFIDDMMRKGV